MSQVPRNRAPDRFEQQLAALRQRIDALPASQRGHLYRLAEAIAQRHHQLERHVASAHDLIGTGDTNRTAPTTGSR